MPRPPRIPVLIPEDKPVVYFLTICTERKTPVLANLEFFRAALLVIDQLDRWKVWAITIMPDHLHILVSPPQRDISIGDFSKLMKVGLKRELNPPIKWQEGCFDHLLRSEESGLQKWQYMRENPVRASLVGNWQDWPFQKGFYD